MGSRKHILRSATSRFVLSFALVLGFVFTFSPFVWALTPDQVLVIANKNERHSVDLARYYIRQRNIPRGNLIQLDAPKGESCSRDDYDRHIASPVRAFLNEHDPLGGRFRCLVTLYGVPLRVEAPRLNSEESKELLKLDDELVALREKMFKENRGKNEEALKPLKEQEAQLKRKIQHVKKAFQVAAVDSELALVREDHYSLEGWLPNLYFRGYRGKELKDMPKKVILVSRLDGPTEKIVRRIIDDSIATEEVGLKGKAYFDARWPDPGERPPVSPGKDDSGYRFCDWAIHNAARIAEKAKRMPVVIDSQQAVFQPGQCPDAALYCGWYSLAKYVDAFTWAKGAVGYHIASAECTTLKERGSKVWCKVMLEKGVAATLGPVAEPYVESFPMPDLFFDLLMEGRLPLVECYALSNPFWSWQIVLIGDPLYRPFKPAAAEPAK